MKILHVIPQVRIGNGAAKLLFDLLPYQKKEFERVDVLTWQVLSPSFAEDIRALGCGLEVLGVGYYNPLVLFRLARKMKQYDVVHVHLFPALYWVALAKVFCHRRLKLVLTEHSTKNNRQGKPLLRYVEKFMYRQYDRVIAISGAVKEELSRLIPPSRVEVIYNGINLQQIAEAPPLERKDLGIPQDSFVLVQVARFYPQKDQKTVLCALSDLPSMFYAVFVGDGPLLQEHEEYAAALAVQERVRFLGVRNDVSSVLKVADVFVMSSHFEGFGLAAVEGMAAGLPVVASDVEGLREVVAGAGVLFVPHDEKMLASQLTRLAYKPEYYRQVADACKRRSSLFDIRKMAKEYSAVYEKL
ncbi:MAG: glycosyltransferase [Bacteroidaceae bacterium]|jgi:glycosyltransferase involved in cell wall biosynthesis